MHTNHHDNSQPGLLWLSVCLFLVGSIPDIFCLSAVSQLARDIVPVLQAIFLILSIVVLIIAMLKKKPDPDQQRTDSQGPDV